MATITTNIAHLPLAYRCAIEMLDSGERTHERFLAMCEHFEHTCALVDNEHASMWRESAWEIARRRYWIAQEAL